MSVFGRLYRGETDFDFLGRRNLWFALSGAVLLICLGSIFFRPTATPCRPPLPQGLNCGIEFNGGLSITAPVAPDGPLGDATDLEVIAEVRDALEDAGEESGQVQVSTTGDERSVLVQTAEEGQGEERIRVVNTVRETVGASVEDTTVESISASFGGDITSKALRALVVFLVVVVIFITWRFEWGMALGSIVAMFHDLIVTAGIYSLLGFEVTPSTIVAILTILGYSLYDNVVVFDKVEENTAALAATGRMTYQDAANVAMNQVFMRSLNTSLSTLLPVTALLVVGTGLFGASTLQDLALALFVGLLSGTYSSMFVATPILTMLKEREPKYRNVREKVLRDARRTAAQEKRDERTPAPVGAGGGVDEGKESRSAGTRPSAAPSSSRPRAGSKKAKRRKRR